MSADSASSPPGRTTTPVPRRLPRSDVSAGVGLAGLLGLVGWILVCRSYPAIAEALGLSGELSGARGVLSGPHAALAAMLFTAGPMAAWSVLVDKVHRNPSTGLDWSLRRPLGEAMSFSLVKITGLWATFAIIAGLYALCRWYWQGTYLFAMEVLAFALVPLLVASVPYVIWLDRFMIAPRDATWHFGAMILSREGWERDSIAKHARAWIIKGFFGAFMISILPAGFAQVVEADPAAMLADPVALAGFLIALLFVVDVQIGTVGYCLTLRPLDAHIRSGNPFLGGWIAALICYPPFVWGIMGGGNMVVSYEHDVAGWGHWLAGQGPLLWLWAGWLVLLTAIYAWATIAFGIRFSNLTYRGVVTNGPYRFTRHPAYLSKNLFWWCSVMPFLVTSHSAADAIRNTLFLLVVNAIYYWRAKTEEAHLLAEDAKYREYHAWMEHHGAITARLARLVRAFGGRKAAGTSGALAEPAE